MNIGLIAMSGIRACDAELLELGLTLPGFVERSKTVASLPSLGLLTLAGLTPKQHHVQYIEVAQLDDCELPDRFDLVGVSSFTAQAPESYEIARHYAARGVPVVVGGLHATAVPDEITATGASVAIGEGEVTWPEILRDAARGRLEPVYDARGREFDLARAPMPAFDLLDIDRYNRLTVQTSRGCPWRCSFCASSILLTRRYKQKPPALVLREIDCIRELWPQPFIEFADDNAFVNRAYWHKLAPELARRKIRWFAETDISVSDDDDLLRALRRAGCEEVLIGFESPVAEGLDGLELRRNWKLRRFEQYRDAVRRIQSHGIRVNACFVLGLDGQPAGVFDAVADFVDEVAPWDVQITYQTPFPGTPLYSRLRDEGRLTHDRDWGRYTLFDINYEPTPMSARELRDGFLDLTRRLYDADATKRRRRAATRRKTGANRWKIRRPALPWRLNVL